MQNITCKDCYSTFSLDQHDLEFYKVASPIINNQIYPISLPTQCPNCRERRRLAWRNDRSLYKRNCSLCNKSIISCYSKNYAAPVYCSSCWHSDNWNPDDYFVDYDVNRPFFDQFNELLLKTPHLALLNVNPTNSDYGNHTVDLKNCYLVFASGWNEDVQYAARTWKNKNCLDLIESGENELCYSVVNCHKCYDLKYSLNCNVCSNSYFLNDCVGCSDCFCSVNLRNAKYIFFNEQLSETEYNKRISQMNFGSYQTIEKIKKAFNEHIKKHPVRYAKLNNCQDCTGDMLINSKNSQNCYNLNGAEDCRHCELGVSPQKSYDCSGVSYGEYCLGIVNHVSSTRTISGIITYYNENALYIYNCVSCHDILGCTGLKHKQYRILNKQYLKEEYEKIFAQIATELLDKKIWGHLFPSQLSPFSYQETEASAVYPIDRKDALELKFNYIDLPLEESDINKFVSANDLADNINNVEAKITELPIKCGISGKMFMINKSEFSFYKNNTIPIPRKHSYERYLGLLNLRNPRKLESLNCSKCSKSIQTNYPETQKLILCEECYYKEVY